MLQKELAFGIAILFIVTSIIPCMGQRIDKIGDIKNADFGNINDVIQANKGEIHNAPYPEAHQIFWHNPSNHQKIC